MIPFRSGAGGQSGAAFLAQSIDAYDASPIVFSKHFSGGEQVSLEDGPSVGAKIKLDLLGPFTLLDPTGQRIEISGRKTRAVLALLAVSPKGTRGRKWLQYRLWSERGDKEGAASLRQCLRELRQHLDKFDIISADRQSLTLDLSKVSIDVRMIGQTNPAKGVGPLGEFLEDLDIQDPEFESWLRNQRLYWEEQIQNSTHDGGELATHTAAPATVSMVEPADQQTTAGPIVALKPLAFQGLGKPSPYLWEGLADSILEQLSCHRGLSIISRMSSQEADLQTTSLLDFGNAVGAKYVVTGHLRENADAFLLKLELMQHPEQTVLWSGEFRISLPEKKDVLRLVASEIAGNLGAQINQFHERKTPKIQTEDPAVSHLIWRGRWHLNRLSKSDSKQAQALFEQAHAIDDRSVDAHVHLAWSLLWQAWASRGGRDNILKGRDLAQRAINLDSTDGRAYWIVGTAQCWLRNHDAAYRYVKQSIELCPSLSIAHAQQGSNCILSGKPQEAFAHLQRALVLSPHDQQKFYFLGELAMAAYLVGRHEDALDFANQALMLRPGYWYARLIQLLAQLQLGSHQGVESARERLLVSRPNLSRKDIDWLPFRDQSVTQDIISKLRTVGLLLPGENSSESEKIL